MQYRPNIFFPKSTEDGYIPITKSKLATSVQRLDHIKYKSTAGQDWDLSLMCAFKRGGCGAGLPLTLTLLLAFEAFVRWMVVATSERSSGGIASLLGHYLVLPQGTTFPDSAGNGIKSPGTREGIKVGILLSRRLSWPKNITSDTSGQKVRKAPGEWRGSVLPHFLCRWHQESQQWKPRGGWDQRRGNEWAGGMATDPFINIKNVN